MTLRDALEILAAQGASPGPYGQNSSEVRLVVEPHRLAALCEILGVQSKSSVLGSRLVYDIAHARVGSLGVTLTTPIRKATKAEVEAYIAEAFADA